ncbi:hypothetical protein RN001_000119 [Aquatica leii]|uniref:Odorant-binding protein n=1 Tax=Aquatica leii TaxID=1421715 RepID=A0AAN7QLV5_9COLE|nr:hypothetical protein RN001_000119 [Aquatica leii]
MRTIVFVTLLSASFVSSTWVLPSNITDSWLALVNPFFSECICQTRVKPHIALRAIANTDLVDDACLKCFIKCLAINLNFFNTATGMVDQALVVSKIAGVTPEIISYCNDLTNNEMDVCQGAYDFFVCFAFAVANATMI